VSDAATHFSDRIYGINKMNFLEKNALWKLGNLRLKIL